MHVVRYINAPWLVSKLTVIIVILLLFIISCVMGVFVCMCVCVCYCWSLLYNVILCSKADSLCLHVILPQWIAFYSTFLNIHGSGVLACGCVRVCVCVCVVRVCVCVHVHVCVFLSPLSKQEEAGERWLLSDDLPRTLRAPHSGALSLLPCLYHRPALHLQWLCYWQCRGCVAVCQCSGCVAVCQCHGCVAICQCRGCIAMCQCMAVCQCCGCVAMCQCCVCRCCGCVAMCQSCGCVAMCQYHGYIELCHFSQMCNYISSVTV